VSKAWWITSALWSGSQIPPFQDLVGVFAFVAVTATQSFLSLPRNTDGIHLKQCVTLYLFALPFTMVNDLGWSTVPLVTVVAFTLMGIEGIADEIEMPFGSSLVDI
jgi:Bestrophin, RFP-TM, chloride channel